MHLTFSLVAFSFAFPLYLDLTFWKYKYIASKITIHFPEFKALKCSISSEKKIDLSPSNVHFILVSAIVNRSLRILGRKSYSVSGSLPPVTTQS